MGQPNIFKPKILTTMRSYSKALFLADLFAGTTVALVAIPLSLAIAIASGADPAAGLVTAIIGGFFISLLGGSRVQIGGPTGAFIVVVFGVIQQHGYDGLVIATFLAGIILLIAGWLRLGALIAYVPEPVVNGFTIGIAIIIATSQISDFFGLTVAHMPADFLEKIPALWGARGGLSLAALATGLVTAVLIVVLRRGFPKFPGLIVAIAITSGLVAWAGLDVDTIGTRFGDLPHQLPWPHVPDISLATIADLLPSAFVIAFLAGVESLLSALVADRMSGGSYRPNAEVVAQGVANIASSLFGGMPATGAIARTATNVRAGGKTPVAGLIHALVILLIMMLAAHLASFMAMPAMAALLILTAYNMSEPHKWRSYAEGRRSDLALLLMTLVLTVLVNLTVAIAVGVSVGLAQRLARRRLEPKPWEPPQA